MPKNETITLEVDGQNQIKMTKDGAPFDGQIRISRKDRVLFSYAEGAIAFFIKSFMSARSRKKRTLRQRAMNYNGETPFHRAVEADRGWIQLEVKEDVKKGDKYDYALAVVRPNGRIASLDPQIIIE